VLAVLTSVVEAGGAFLVYVLLKLVTAPDDPIDLPVIGNLHDRFPALSQQALVRWSAGFIGVFFLLRAGLYLVQTYLQNRVAHNATVALSGRLLRGYLAMSYPAHLARSSAESIRNAHESSQLLAQHVLVPGVTVVSEGFLAVVVFLVLFVIAPLMTALTLLVLIPLVFILVKGLQPALTRHGRQAQDMSTDSLASLSQTLTGYRDVKLLGKERYFERRFLESRTRLARAFYLRSLMIDVPRVGVETGLILFIVAFLAVSVGKDGADASTVTALGFFAYAGLRILPSLNRIMVCLQTIRFGLPLVGHLHDDLVATEAAVEAYRMPSATPMSFDRDIRFEHVTVRYEGADRDAIVDAELTIRRGEWIGVVGPTGGGKTTLVDVLTGLLPPTRGRVLVDGREIADDPRAWQRHIGVVSQMVFLLDDSLRRNVALGLEDDEIDEEHLRRAIHLARLDEWVATLPEGLHTIAGERGVKISGGQRQRIAIARALYCDPDVLVFDEGTSALDRATESEVIGALQGLRGERTVVTIAHRLSTVRGCDRIVVVRDGRLAAVGTYQELERTSVDFRALTR
jgi:ATP-binding cassette subfamily C protein